MKKLLSFFLLISLMSLFYVEAYAYDIEVKNAEGKTIYYNYINDGKELEVTYKTWRNNVNWTENKEAYSGEIVIPSEVTYMNRTRKVTSIGEWAFNDCFDMTSITIPSSINTIYGCAFYECTGLKKVITKDIDSWCKIIYISNSFGSIWEANPLEHAHHLFSDENTEITELTIPNDVTSLSMNFSGWSGLTSVIIPESVKILGWGTFNQCSGLSVITVPKSVEEIGFHAFNGCTSLTSINIPSSVNSIGLYAFAGCTSLTSIKVDTDNTVFDSRNDCNAIIETAKNILVSGCKSTIIPYGVTSIGPNAFQGCTGLTSISIPNSVIEIEYAAFIDCLCLESLIIPNSVTFIDSYAFKNCDNLNLVVSLLEEPCYLSAQEPFSKQTFYNGTLYVPEGSIEKYKKKNVWNNFVNIVEGNSIGIRPIETNNDFKLLLSDKNWN